MKIHGLLLAFAVVISGCSTKEKRKIKSSLDGAPSWVSNIGDYCDEKRDLCASAEGINYKQSDLLATKNIAAYFSTKIDGTFQHTRHSFSNQEIQEMQEIVNSEVDQHISQILKGVEIKERFKSSDAHYSLVVLDKKKSGSILRQEIKRIDDKMNYFYAQKNRLYLKKLNVLFNLRSQVREKLTLLDMKTSSSPISISQINLLKFKSTGGNLVQLRVKEAMPRLLEKKIEELFLELGYKIKETTPIDYIVEVDYKIKEEYLNVEGFKKYSYSVNFESKDKNGKRLGGYIINTSANGRTQKNSFFKVQDEMLKNIEDNIVKLNLD